MEIRAIYLPDLAFDPSLGNFIFKLDLSDNKFKMMIDESFQYDVDSVINDIDFLIVATEITKKSWKLSSEARIESLGEYRIIEHKNLLKEIDFLKKEMNL